MKKKAKGQKKSVILWVDSEGDAWSRPPNMKTAQQITPDRLKEYLRKGYSVSLVKSS